MKKLELCDLCGNQVFEFLFDCYDRMFKIDKKYSLYKCKKCGLIFLNPQPNIKELSKHYEEYCSLNGENQSKLENILFKLYYTKNNNIIFKIIFLPFKPLLRCVKIVKNGNFLDIGCGVGNYLSLMKLTNMNCYGVEPGRFDKKITKKNKLKIFNGYLKNANYPDNYFDTITLNSVFEHVNNPTETLEELHRILKPKGTIIMTVPRSDCFVYKLFKENWVQLDIPRHMFIYSISNLKKYVKKTSFKIKKIRYNSLPFQFVGSILYWSNKYRKKPIYMSETNVTNNKILFLLLLPLSYFFNILKIGDQVEITFTK